MPGDQRGRVAGGPCDEADVGRLGLYGGNCDEEGTHAEKSVVEGYEEIVARGCSHAAVETVQRDDFFRKEHRLLSQDP